MNRRTQKTRREPLAPRKPNASDVLASVSFPALFTHGRTRDRAAFDGQQAAGPQLEGCRELSGITALGRAGRGRFESLDVDPQAAGRAQHDNIVVQLQ